MRFGQVYTYICMDRVHYKTVPKIWKWPKYSNIHLNIGRWMDRLVFVVLHYLAIYVKFRNMQTRTSYCLEIGTKWNYRNNKYQIQQHRCLDEEDGIREEAEGTSVASEDSSVSQAECGYTAVHCVILPTLDKSENMYVQLIMYRLYIFYLSFQVG